MNDFLMVRSRRRATGLLAQGARTASEGLLSSSLALTQYPGFGAPGATDRHSFGLGFQPDFLLTKSLNSSSDAFRLLDSVRGVSRDFNIVNSETELSYLLGNPIAFHSNGYTANAISGYSAASGSFLSLALRRSIATGLDIVTYNGTGALQTIPHNLGVAPAAIWVKSREYNEPWTIYSAQLDTPGTQALSISSSAAVTTATTFWGSTTATSTGFTVGTNSRTNFNFDPYIAYVFAPTSNVFAAGRYSGTGVAQSIAVGFQPRLVIIKRVNASGSWIVFNALRGGSSHLTLESAISETITSGLSIVFQANGFQVSTNTQINASGGSYLWWAWA